MEGPATLRILLLGESQNGKSSLANTIFGEAIFKVKEFNDAKSFTTEAKTKFVNGRNFTLIDTPGLFDSGRPQKTVKSELMRCMIESAPGPHIFLIILKVEKYTEQEKDVIAKIRRHFSDDALKYVALIFTHGDQLPEGMNIQQYAAQSDGLWELVQKCGGRCHVFDNRYWRNTEEEEYRSNKFQLAELFKTIDKILIKNKGGHFSNTILNEIETEIQKEIELLKLSSENMSEEEIKQQVKSIVLKKQSSKKEERLWKMVSFGVGVFSMFIIFRRAINTAEAPPLTIDLLKDTVQQTTEDAIPNTFEVISNYFALYEKTYSPFCPFE
ncbi:GTPase IMAP family member 7-like [Cyprinodon tularosa]|uniref:GTPase IMAP family member 7-like n=1 Tax=Cyprinodon tularosa TaxID=77115 RepID=UPI0018E20285|nr:GTPase IMAP family member 7-like [Cyprinodon tularosa]